MLLRNVYGMTLWENRRALFGWGIAMAAVTLMYSATYPTLGKGKADIIKGYPEGLRKALNLQDFGSPAGYLASTVFGILLLMLITVFVIISGTRAIAGDEESGILDLLLAHPVGRGRLLLERMAAIASTLVVMGAIVLAVLLAIRGPANRVALAAIALLAGAATGHRSTTIGITVVVAVVSYLGDTFLPQVHGLAWMRHISPYHWFSGGDPLRNGLQLTGCGLLLGLTAVALAAALMLLRRRDVNV